MHYETHPEAFLGVLALVALQGLLLGCGPIVLGDLPGGAEPVEEPPVPEDPPHQPRKGDVLWSAAHEGGDLSEWEIGGAAQGGQYVWGTGATAVTGEVSRTGQSALALSIDTNGVSPSDGARVYRRVARGAAFYESWMRIQDAHAVSDWWAIVVFHARDASLSTQNVVQLWDLRVMETAGGSMALEFFDHADASAVTASAAGVILPGTWFHLETYLDYRPPAATELRVWLNGALIFDMRNLSTSVEDNVFWLLGNGAAGLNPTLSTLYVDDAALTEAIVDP